LPFAAILFLFWFSVDVVMNLDPVFAQEARPARRAVLAGILAAGAALGVSGQQALAAGNPVGDVQGAVEEAGAGIKQRIDGIFGKNSV